MKKSTEQKMGLAKKKTFMTFDVEAKGDCMVKEWDFEAEKILKVCFNNYSTFLI